MEPISLAIAIYMTGSFTLLGYTVASDIVSSKAEQMSNSLLIKGEKIIENQLMNLSSKATKIGVITVSSVVVTTGATAYYFKRKADKLQKEQKNQREKLEELTQRVNTKNFQEQQLLAQIQVPPKR